MSKGVNPDYILDKLSSVIARENLTLDSKLAAEISGQSKAVIVAAPADEQQVSDILRMSNEEEWATLPLGGGTHAGGVDVPDDFDIAISSRQLNRIVDYSPADMVVTAQAGLLLSELQKELANYGQMLPVDPVCQKQCTIGGAVAVGASGPMQLHYGTLRDMAVGMRVVYPDGRVIKTGSKVVKNVAGYDITKLFAGSYGTLAYISEISFKLRPLPLYHSLVTAAGSPEESREFVHRIIHSRLVPSRVEALIGNYPFLQGGDRVWHVAVDCHENRLAGEFQANVLTKLAQELGMSSTVYTGENAGQFWHNYHEHLQPSTLIIRYSVQPANMMTTSRYILNELQELGTTAHLSVSAPRGVGRVYAKDLTPELEQSTVISVRHIVEQQGGFAVIENGALALRRQVDAFGIRRKDFRLMRDIKRSIDPNGIMNKGRLRGIETWDRANLKS